MKLLEHYRPPTPRRQARLIERRVRP
jgi:hypothetical protein